MLKALEASWVDTISKEEIPYIKIPRQKEKWRKIIDKDDEELDLNVSKRSTAHLEMASASSG